MKGCRTVVRQKVGVGVRITVVHRLRVQVPPQHHIDKQHLETSCRQRSNFYLAHVCGAEVEQGPREAGQGDDKGEMGRVWTDAVVQPLPPHPPHHRHRSNATQYD